MKYSAPRSPQELFRLFSLLDRGAEFRSILDKIEWTGVLPCQVYFAALGRVPESARAALPTPDYSAKDHLNTAVRSPEFQIAVVEQLLASIPGHQRLLFIHIPKCAGNSFVRSLSLRVPTLPLIMGSRGWVNHTQLCGMIRTFVHETSLSGSVLVHGHATLRHFLDRKLYRFADRVLTLVRDPIDILISEANYIATVIHDDTGFTRPDTREWRSRLGLHELPSDADDRFFGGLAKRILLDDCFVSRNPLCTYLGKGTFVSVMETLALCRTEITDIAHSSSWLRQEWHIPTMARENVSRQFIRRQDLDASAHEYLAEMTIEDTTLYAAIKEYLDSSNEPVVQGAELAWRHFGTTPPVV